MSIIRSTGIMLLLLFSSAQVGVAEETWPGQAWAAMTPEQAGMNRAKLEEARRYALSGGGSGVVTRHGKLVMSWGDQKRRYDLKSTTKSIGVTALGLAIGDGKIRLSDPAAKHHPSFGFPPDANRQTGWLSKITIEQLATQTAGFEKPGGYTRLVFAPGEKWSYSDGGPNWLAECVALAYQQDVDELMFARVFSPLGITRDDLRWRRNSYRPAKLDGVMRREFGSGVSANVNAMARIGYLYLREGTWRGKQIVPKSFVTRARTTSEAVVGLPEVDPKSYGNASDHYGLLWWNNADGSLKNVPRDAYWSWGLYESLIVVIPSLDIVAARAGKSWKREWAGHYRVLQPFFEPIVASARIGGGKEERQQTGASPYPASPVITSVQWDDPSTVIRKARGGDNWPLTWGDDDAMYTAYGDGNGFAPQVKQKLSLGLARIEGGPKNFRGLNVRSPSAEQRGGGSGGMKASGMLMVDGVLYMLARNADNARLARSQDRGRTWIWADWRFQESFGYPTFLNFGRDYDGARDDYVYVYSHDQDSAYKRADRMVLARVPRNQLMKRQAYEFFVRKAAGQPEWSRDVEQRGAVFLHPGACYRSSVSYNAGLKRYLWCQTGAGADTRFQGGFAIYDAPEPWGPWTTVFHTRQWDIGPGETSCLPTKWMSPDGKTVHLVFSGDDHFSVRRAVLGVPRD